jgi:hypothetical protein
MAKSLTETIYSTLNSKLLIAKPSPYNKAILLLISCFKGDDVSSELRYAEHTMSITSKILQVN